MNELPSMSKKEGKMLQRVLKPKKIQRKTDEVGVFESLKLTWYLDSWISKLIFIYGGLSAVATVFYLISLIF